MVEQFGTYRLHEKVAQGGMAEVFVATDQSGRRVAIKRMFSHLVDQQDLRNMFIDEARIASRLDHPNIVDIYDLGTVDETFYIAMEYVEGLDLRRACEQGVAENHFVSRPLAAYIVAQLAAGLEYAHGQTDENGRPMNIIHRDVSPQNVLLSLDGEVKLCDFGIAKAESRLTETRFGEMKGKYSYMSPEQFGQGRLDHRSDIFTLGIVLYETTAITRLFRAENQYETMQIVTNGDFDPPSAVRDGYPKALEKIVMRALAVDPDDRYQSAGAMRRDLREWMAGRRLGVGQREMAEYVRELMDEPAPALEETGEMSTEAFAGPREDTEGEDSTMEMTVSDDQLERMEQSGGEVDGDVTAELTISEEKFDRKPDSSGANSGVGTSGGDATVDETISEDELTSATVPDAENPLMGSDSGPDGGRETGGEFEAQKTRVQPGGSDEAPADDEFGEPKTQVSRPEPGEPEESNVGDGSVDTDDEFGEPKTQVSRPEPVGAEESNVGDGSVDIDDEFGEPKTRVSRPESGDSQAASGGGDGPEGGGEFEELKTNVVGGAEASTTSPEGEKPRRRFDDPKSEIEEPGSGPGAGEGGDRGAVGTPDRSAGPEAKVDREPPSDQDGESLDEIPDLRGGGRELTGIEELPAGSPTESDAGVEERRDDAAGPMPWGWSLPGDGSRRWIQLAVIGVAVAAVVAGGIAWLVVADGDGERPELVETRVVGDETTTLQLETRPRGAKVVANGVVADGETPMDIPLVRGVENELSVFHDGRRPVRLLVTGEGTSMERQIDLERAPITEVADVEFRSEPTGATVSVDGREIGETPVRMENISAHFERHVQFDKEGYRPSVSFVDLAGGDSRELNAELAPREAREVVGRYRVRPQGAVVSMEGEPVGETPFERRHRVGDWLTVETSGEGRQTDQRRLRLDRVGNFELKTELAEEVEATGAVSVEAGSPAAVYIDGRALGNLPVEGIEIPAGERSMVFETDEGERVESSLQIEADADHRYRADLSDGGVQLESIDE